MDTITWAEVAQLAIVGSFVSVAVQFLKSTFSTSTGVLRLAVIALSVGLGALYWLLRDTSFLTAAFGILSVANTVFLFVLRPLEEAGKLPEAK